MATDAQGPTRDRMWGGRFQGDTDRLVEQFGASIDVDRQMAIEDIEGSIAHTTMLGECAILSSEDVRKILDGLASIRRDVEENKMTWTSALEDVHMNIEHALTARIGPVGGKLHTARSRNDQVATDLRLWLRRAGQRIQSRLHDMRSQLVGMAERNLDVIMPGYTHLQVAQPVRLAQHCMAYYAMFTRDAERLDQLIERMNRSPLGTGALAGTSFAIDRERTAELLDFKGVEVNSMDAVSDRDFAIEFLAFCSLVMVHLSRLSEDLILWSSQEFAFITLPDSHATGSSIMPQKKNPDMCELIRGKTGRVCGALMGLLMTMKGLPLSYNKDMQEDKEGVFDAARTVRMSLEIYISMLPGIEVHADRMREAAASAFSNATDLADYLVRKGLPFREAHEVVGRLVADCIADGGALADLSLARFQSASSLIQSDVYATLALDSVVDTRTSLGGTARSEVEQQIRVAKAALA